MTNIKASESTTMSPVVSISDGTFEAEVLESGTPVLVDFWAPWCGPCRMLGPILEELAGEFDGKIKIAKINVDENPMTAAKMGVQAIPFLALFNDGKPVNAVVGVRPKQELSRLIESVLPVS